LRATTPPLPDEKFDLILVDPPWHFQDYRNRKSARNIPYGLMDLDAICRLPVAQCAAPNAVLAIWVFGAGVAQTLRVINAWGFREANEGFVWIKVAKNARPHPGMGQSTRKDSESMWLAKRGNGLPRQDKGVGQTIVAQRREHSRKPDEAYTALERLYGDVRRIELFSRRERPGWARWGNELLPPDTEPRLPFADGELFEELRA
jgi:N6-adenosine-specific RNA methylase IME4